VLQPQDATTSAQKAELDAVNRQLAQVEAWYNLQSVRLPTFIEAQARAGQRASASSLNLEANWRFAKGGKHVPCLASMWGELFRLDERSRYSVLEGSVSMAWA